MRQLDQPADEAERPGAEGELRPPGGAEEVGGERKAGALDVGEEEGRASGGDHPAVDLGRLQAGVDRHRDLGEIAVSSSTERGRPAGRGRSVRPRRARVYPADAADAAGAADTADTADAAGREKIPGERSWRSPMPPTARRPEENAEEMPPVRAAPDRSCGGSA